MGAERLKAPHRNKTRGRKRKRKRRRRSGALEWDGDLNQVREVWWGETMNSLKCIEEYFKINAKINACRFLAASFRAHSNR